MLGDLRTYTGQEVDGFIREIRKSFPHFQGFGHHYTKKQIQSIKDRLWRNLDRSIKRQTYKNHFESHFDGLWYICRDISQGWTREWYEIWYPYLHAVFTVERDFRGTPCGLDIR